MSNSEDILLRLVDIQEKDDVSLVEAAIIFCEQMDIDPSEFKNMLDTNTIERLKYDAIVNKKVRKKTGHMRPQLFE